MCFFTQASFAHANGKHATCARFAWAELPSPATLVCTCSRLDSACFALWCWLIAAGETNQSGKVERRWTSTVEIVDRAPVTQ